MIVFVFILIAVLSLMMFYICITKDHQISSLVFGFSGFISLLASIIMCVAALNVKIKNPAYVEQNQVLRQQLIYQLENEVYKEDIIGTQQLYNQIKDFNSDLAFYHEIQNNIWIRCFYPDCSEIDFIELK